MLGMRSLPPLSRSILQRFRQAICEFLKIHPRDLEMDIDPIEQWTGDPLLGRSNQIRGHLGGR